MDAVADIMGMIHELTGIKLGESKRSLVQARLGKRLRQLGCDLDQYAMALRSDQQELVRCIDQLTTNHTAWKREPSHFADLAQRILSRPRERLRIWCAAAATGEEPWTIALTVLKNLPEPGRCDAAILATDISTQALAQAHRGIYGESRISALDPEERRIALVPGPSPGEWSVAPALRRMLTFARLNLMASWPMQGPFDAIFCRNVMIYFDQPTQQRLVNRLAELLAPGGTLYVGHSESLSAIRHPLRPLGPATYARN